MEQRSQVAMTNQDVLERIKAAFKPVKPAMILNHGLMYQHKVMTSFSPLSYKHIYNVYSICLGVGGRPKFLFTLPCDVLPSGEIPIFANHLKLFDAQTPEPTEEGKKLLAPNPVAKKEGTKISGWDFIRSENLNEPVFFIKSMPFPTGEFRDFISTFSNEDFKELFSLYLAGDGFQTDETIVYAYRTNLIPFTNGNIDPESVMKFNPHGLVCTNTKTRKTTLGRITGDVLDRASSARFLGFSTANDAVMGYGNGRWKPIYFDEVDASNKIFIDNIFNYMEIGSTIVSVGREDIKTHGWSTMVFHSNPKTESSNPMSLYLAFNEFLNYFSEKVDGMGSRIAVVLFGTDFKTYGKTGSITSEDKNLIKAFVDSIIDMLIPRVENLITDERIKDWLYQPIPGYKESIIAMLSSNPNLPDKIKRFWKSHTDGHTHMRGFALKQAIFENVADVLRDDSDIGKLLECAEEHLKRLEEINLVSLKKMSVNVPFRQLLEISYKGMPEYCKGLAIACYAALGKCKVEEPLPFSILSAAYDEAFGKLPMKFRMLSAYSSFSRIESNIRQAELDKINRKLEFLEIRIMDKDGEMFMVPNPSWSKVLQMDILEP
ncbi:MAG: hypothetical protein V1678_05240, partial [Candidatus Aenigmatarchaeota archaeon]